MSDDTICIGTVISDQDSPTFEIVRIKLKAGQDVRPGTLVKIPVDRGTPSTLIARVRSAHENNPNEQPDSINVRDTLGMLAHYPKEGESTTIYRLVEADLVEEIVSQEIRSPQVLPNSGSDVFVAGTDEIVQTLGLVQDEGIGLHIGETVSGTPTRIMLKRDAIQRHMFIGGTTGSGKSYAMGVIAEELQRHKLPIIFIDTQDEYSRLVKTMGGKEVTPGKDFTIRISSLTESELIDLLPDAMKKSALQCDIVAKAFGELQTSAKNEDAPEFTLDDLLTKIEEVAPDLTAKEGDIPRVTDATKRRTATLRKHRIFGSGVHWPDLVSPCLAINCKRLTTVQLQSVATATLRELQSMRLKGEIPPYVAVIDEAHLFVPQGEGSACKQIIREGVRIGRHHGICMVLITQSPVDIDKSVIRQCNTRLVFALEPDQLEAIRGVKSDASEEMLRALPKMPRGTCLLSGTYESVKHTIPVKIRKRHKQDSEGGKTPDIFAEMQDRWLNQA
jgi:hypothetical protein